MGIENNVDSSLWGAVSKPYEERNYTAVILDSIQYLGDVIREKTGLASDGVSLVGEAFGGSKPKIRVNRLETETDKNVQGGIEQLVRGLYKAFRNPRAHEKHIDGQEDAHAVLLLITYLLKVIGQAKSPFERTVFLQRVFDEEFVRSERYAELLASEIPARHRFDLLIDIYRQRGMGKEEQLVYILTALWNLVSDESRVDFAAAVSLDLNTLERGELIRMIKLLPTKVWGACEEAARIRVESMLVRSILEGQYDKERDKCLAGILGTWSGRFLENAVLISEFQSAIADRLLSKDDRAVDYIFKFLFTSLIRSVDKPDWWLVHAIDTGLERGDVRFKDALKYTDSRRYDSEASKLTDDYLYPQWRNVFEKSLADFEPKEQDDIPF